MDDSAIQGITRPHANLLSLYTLQAAATLFAFPFVFLKKGLGGKKKDTGGEVTDAVGTIGLFSNISSVKGGYWICFKATIAAIWNLPYCLKRRQVCKHEDFELPLR